MRPAPVIQNNLEHAQGFLIVNPNHVHNGLGRGTVLFVIAPMALVTLLCSYLLFYSRFFFAEAPQFVPITHSGQTLLPATNDGIEFVADARNVDLRTAIDDPYVLPRVTRTITFEKRDESVKTVVLQVANIEHVNYNSRIKAVEAGTLAAPHTSGKSDTPGKEVFNISFDISQLKRDVPETVSFTAEYVNKFQSPTESNFDFTVPFTIRRLDLTLLLPKGVSEGSIHVSTWLHGVTQMPEHDGHSETRPYSGADGPNGIMVHIHIEDAKAGRTHRVSW